jgi:hypothetical protein
VEVHQYFEEHITSIIRVEESATKETCKKEVPNAHHTTWHYMVRIIIAAVRTALPNYYKTKLIFTTIFRTDLIGAMLATVLFRIRSLHGLSRNLKLKIYKTIKYYRFFHTGVEPGPTLVREESV